MTKRGRGQRIALGLADLMFILSSTPVRPNQFAAMGLQDIAAPWLKTGGLIRVAGPKWFAVWGNDHDRMRRLNTLLLPASWIGLTEAEMAAVLLRQIAARMPGVTAPSEFAEALGRAKSKLWLANMRGD